MTEEIWKGIKKKGVLPHIVTKEDYLLATAKGMGAAAALLAKLPTIRPNANLLRLIHALIFQNATPWAGEFTKTILITNKFVTSDPQSIHLNITKARKGWEKKKDPTPPEDRARYLAWLTARLLRIHPFTDGNKRTILSLVLALLTRELSKTPDTALLQKKLSATIPETRKGNIQPLGELFLAASGLEIPKNYGWKLPYSINPHISTPKPEDPPLWP